MNYQFRYFSFIFLLLHSGCKEVTCTSAKMAKEKGFSQIKTSARVFPAAGTWLHRTNDTSKFLKNASAYPGFEMDVNIDSKNMWLDIYHLPEPSQNIHAEDYLKNPLAQNKFFWFDCKNLDAGNVNNAITILNRLDSAYHIKQRMVFESMNHVLLKNIAAAGYYCVYYLPIPANADLCNDTAFITQTAARIDSSFCGISADGQYIKELNTIFPHCKKFTWSTSRVRNLLGNEKEDLQKDSVVQIVLERER